MATSWHFNNGSCYAIPTESPDSFTQKSAECGNLGASLVEIETAEEFDFVLSVIEVHGGQSQYWVGLQGSYSSYTWINSGGSPDPAFWKPGDPNNNGINCIRFRDNGDTFALADTVCSKSYDVICEKSPSLSIASSPRDVTEYTRITPHSPAFTWPLCHVTQAVRRSRAHCATWCGASVTCVGFEFLEVTSSCTLVSLDPACGAGQMFTPATDGSFYVNEHEDLYTC